MFGHHGFLYLSGVGRKLFVFFTHDKAGPVWFDTVGVEATLYLKSVSVREVEPGARFVFFTDGVWIYCWYP